MASTTATVAAEASEQVHRPTHLKHYFVSSEQQFDAAKLGMWLFLLTEILLFSGMFVAYAVYRTWHPEIFAEMSGALDWHLGGLNTLVLLASSLTVALAINAAQTDNRRAVVINLIITIALAGVFLFIKYVEYSGKFAAGVFPGANYHPTGEHYGHYADIPYAPIFFSIYFVMTGIHAVHVIVGMVLIGIMAWRANRGDFNSEYYTPVELTGLYWHLVDIIWIFLFPLLYLI